jgi:hypothetical protein
MIRLHPHAPGVCRHLLEKAVGREHFLQQLEDGFAKILCARETSYFIAPVGQLKGAFSVVYANVQGCSAFYA